jgi:predicted GIY-YIG superfamily endonuclease
MTELSDIVDLEVPLRWSAPDEELKLHLDERVPEAAHIDDELLPATDFGLIVSVLSTVFSDLGFEPSSHYVYILECSVPDRERGKKQSLKLRDNGEIHGWLDRIYEGKEVFYVGATGNPYRRLWEHIRFEHQRGAHFTTVCKPTKLRYLEPYPTRDEAETKEAELRQKINELGGKGSGRAFAYSDLESEECSWNDETLGRVNRRSREWWDEHPEPTPFDAEDRMVEMNELFWDETDLPEEWK